MSSDESQTASTMAPTSTDADQQDKLLAMLPTELNNMITKLLLEDANFCAWFKLRFVSRFWKKEIEQEFARKYLSKTTIDFVEGDLLLFSMELDSLLEQDTVAVFKAPDPLADMRKMLTRLANEATSPERLFESNFYLVTVADEACSDPKLDGLQANTEEGTISLPWIPMMSQVLGDEVRLRRRTVAICDLGGQPEPQVQTVDTRNAPLKLASDWSKNRAMRPMLLYSISRTGSFMAEIQNIRNSRIRRQYRLSLSKEQDKALTKDVGELGPLDRVHKIFVIRKAFRSQWTRLAQ
ncbi:hypothetical protein F4811DRAFT_404760 [Daldinia bambusicola]|nr:hypothetical protein F4811DRAFT_404760 [Daldinia bambusicola]